MSACWLWVEGVGEVEGGVIPFSRAFSEGNVGVWEPEGWTVGVGEMDREGWMGWSVVDMMMTTTGLVCL